VKEIAYIPHPKRIPFEYNQITNNIFIGSNQCCQVHFKKQLLDKGIKATISLEIKRIDAPHGVDYFLWLPTVDTKAPSQKQLLIGAQAIKIFVDGGIKVYVHCLRGHGRSPTLVAAYFILEGLTTNKAIKKIRSKRLVHLRAVQIKALRKFESSKKK